MSTMLKIDRLLIIVVFLCYCTTSTSSLIVQNKNLGIGSLRSGSKICSHVSEPLLLRTARGEEVERVPVWMMRQAGRHMKV